MPGHASLAPVMSQPAVQLRQVADADLPVFFAQQCDPAACWMADFPSRDLASFTAHWERIRSDDAVVLRTIVAAGQVAGHISSFPADGRREVGYWLGQAYWGRGIGARALAEFLHLEKRRPLHAFAVADHFASRRVLEKSGFSACEEVQAFSALRGHPVLGILYILTAGEPGRQP